MTKAELKLHVHLIEAKIKRQTTSLVMIRNRALNAIDGGDKGGAIKWRAELVEIARLAGEGLKP